MIAGVAGTGGRFVFLIPAVLILMMLGQYSHPVKLCVGLLAVLVLAAEMAPLLDAPWFATTRRPWLVSAISLVALITGFAALLTLATSAAARYDPSMQFLQLLSSLDIAWVTSAMFFGAWRMWGRLAAWLLGSLIIVACVASIAAYLSIVGFAPGGDWLVDGSELLRIVIPADMVAAIAAIAVLLGAGFSQPTVQRSPQS